MGVLYMITREMVIARLKTVNDPEIKKDLITLKMIPKIVIEGNDVAVTVELTTPACPLKNEIKQSVIDALSTIEGVGNVTVELTAKVRPSKANAGEIEHQIKHIILVGSGKGGVGKSTVAVNLAVALGKTGASVGLLDADVYGPSVDIMMNATGKPVQSSDDGKIIIPVESYGIKVISIGLMVEEGQPLIWRGPILHNIMQQFFRDVNWGELDYLIVDLPPGTGDIQLSITQLVKATGAVIVSTPQNIALSDVKRAVSMFEKVDVPILGVIENMSYFICPNCQTQSNIFATGGAESTAKKFNIPFLGALPLTAEIREGSDAGNPIATTDQPIGQQFLKIAQQLAGQISIATMDTSE